MRHSASMYVLSAKLVFILDVDYMIISWQI